MDFKGIRVLVLDGYGRQVPCILTQLHKLGCEITTLNCSKLDVGYTSRYPKNRLVHPETRHDQAALKRVLDRELPSGKYDVVFPMLEPSTEVITENASTYGKYVKIIATPYEAFMRAYDKQVTMLACMDNDIPCPITRRDDETVEEYVAKVGFPLAVKPRKGTGSIGFRKISNAEELKLLLADPAFHVEEQIIQQYIPQTDKQYGAYVVLDRQQKVKSVMVAEKTRYYPIDGGAACFMRSVIRPDIAESSIKLLRALNWEGAAHLDFITDPRDGKAKVMEINGRITASIKMTQLGGIPFVKQMLQYAYNEPIEEYLKETKVDRRLRYFQTDFLWLLKSPERFKSKPSWFSIRRTSDFIFTIKDPIPFFSYSLSHLLTYKEDMKKRNRAIQSK